MLEEAKVGRTARIKGNQRKKKTLGSESWSVSFLIIVLKKIILFK
jgi:hypothetical protein